MTTLDKTAREAAGRALRRAWFESKAQTEWSDLADEAIAAYLDALSSLPEQAVTKEMVERSLAKQQHDLPALPKNWDGYGANPPAVEVVNDVIETIRAGGTNRLVDIVPGSDGSIQAEWHIRGDVDIEYCVDPQGSRSLYVNATRPSGDGVQAGRAEVIEDAARWRALMSSQKMHWMGSAGFEHKLRPGAPEGSNKLEDLDAAPRPGEPWHFGMEFWFGIEADPRFPDTFERRLMVAYVDAIRALSNTQTGGKL